MIYFTTKAYNSEETIRRAIESVLSQTYGDFRYHLCDNGSTDGSSDIIAEYARIDRRIVPFYNSKNMQWTKESEKYIVNMARCLDPNDYLTVLDADDDYEPTFLEKMLTFAQTHDLDFATCRSNHIQEPSGRNMNEVSLMNDIIISSTGFDRLFPEYFRFMGARWGKLQKGSLFRKINWGAFEKWLELLCLSHRHDTASMLYYLQFSKKAGVLSKLLHNYHLYPVSHSTQNIQSKHRDNEKMPDVYREFLIKKVGLVSPENERFIKEVFIRSEKKTEEQGRLINGKT